jgi:ribosomal-protein-alanine N-acetyltransferase
MDKNIKELQNLHIKIIKKNDPYVIGRLIELDKQAFNEGGLDEWTMVPIMRHGRIIALYFSDEIAGGAQFIKDWDNVNKAYLYGISIAKEYRGKGFGTKFLKLCFDELRKEGIDTIELTVDPKNYPAIRVYEQKMGFKIINEHKNEYGKGEHRIVMELNI